VGSLFALSRRRVMIAWVAFALACLTKPQAWAFAPLIFGMSLSRAPGRALVRAGLAAAAATSLCFLPFWWHGTLGGAYAAIFQSTIGGEPFVSCNAANLWWLVTGGNGYDVSDTIRVAGPITLRALGIAAFLGTSAIVVRELARGADEDRRRLFLGTAVVGMGFFLFATELHENHMASVLPLLAFAAGRDRRLWSLVAVLSGTHLANMALFDGAIAGPAAAVLRLPQLPVYELSLALAAINVAAFAVMAGIFVMPRPQVR
jgi:Gpi18-like mannosyltransferase